MRKQTLSLLAAGTVAVASAIGPAFAQPPGEGVVEMLERTRLEPAGPPGALPPVRWDLNYEGVEIGLVYPRDSTELELSIPALGMRQVFSGATRADAKAQMIARLRGDPALVAAIDARASPADMSAGYAPPEARAAMGVDYERLRNLALVDAIAWNYSRPVPVAPFAPVFTPGFVSGYGPGLGPGSAYGYGYAYGYGRSPYYGYGVPRYYGSGYYGPSYYGPSYYGPSYYGPSYYGPGYYGPRLPYGNRPDVGPRLFGAIPVVPQPFVRPFFGVP